MSKFYTFLFFIAVFSSPVLAQSMETPVGMWQTLDDETGEVKSIIEIYEQDGKYFGRIAEILTGNEDAICEKCDGKQKNKPILGLVIIEDLEKDDDEWNGGTIFDPQKGARYRLSAWFDDNVNELYIRGKHWSGLYRTQTWTRKK